MRLSMLAVMTGTALTALGGAVWATVAPKTAGPLLVLIGLAVIVAAFFIWRDEQQEDREDLFTDEYSPAVVSFLAILGSKYNDAQPKIGKQTLMTDVAAAEWPDLAGGAELQREQSRAVKAMAVRLWEEATSDQGLRQKVEAARTPIKKAFREWSRVKESRRRRNRRFTVWLGDRVRPRQTPVLKVWIYVETALPEVEGMPPADFSQYQPLIDDWRKREHE